MKKTTSVIIRVDPELKAQAEEACAYMDITLSQLLRRTMQSAVRQYHQIKASDTAYARNFLEGGAAQIAYDALKRELEANGGSKDYQRPADRPSPESKRGGKAADRVEVVSLPREEPNRERTPTQPRIDAAGNIDTATMSRKLRRQFARDRAKGKV